MNTISNKVVGRACLSALLSFAILAGASAAEGQEAPTQTTPVSAAELWAEGLAKTIQLHGRHSLPGITVTARRSKSALPWQVRGKLRVMRVDFVNAKSLGTSVSYVLSPWQDLAIVAKSRAAAGVITVNQHAIVLGPFSSGDDLEARAALERSSLAVVRDICGAKFCEAGTQVGHTPEESTLAAAPIASEGASAHYFKPYYVKLVYQDKVAGTWDSIAPKRMLLLSRPGGEEGRKLEFFAPREIDRTLPRPHDPSEQRPAPSVDLRAEKAKLDGALASVFVDAVHAALAAGETDRTELDRRKLLERFTPALRKAVFSYVGHSGPAHAAGAAALGRWSRRLELLLTEESFPSHEAGHWPSTALSYSPALVEPLRKLPSADMRKSAQLLEALSKARVQAKRKPGMSPAAFGSYMPSDEELLLAEIGFRLRAALRASGRKPASMQQVRGYRVVVMHPNAKRAMPAKAYLGVDFGF